MSSSSNDFSQNRRISKVTISPISAETLVVRIQSMSSDGKEEDIPRAPRAKPVVRNPGVQDINREQSKSTMTDSQKTASSSSQTATKEQDDSFSKTGNKLDSAPCLKHAAQNINRKASDIPAEKINLCNKCSKSMLSYIFLVQDFLDSLAREIGGDEAPPCLQCARQEVRDSIAASSDIAVLDRKEIGESYKETISRSTTEYKHGQNITDAKKERSRDRTSSKRTARARSYHQESIRNEDTHKNVISSPQVSSNQSQKVDFLYNVSPQSNANQEIKNKNLPVSSDRHIVVINQPSSNNENLSQEHGNICSQNLRQQLEDFRDSYQDSSQQQNIHEQQMVSEQQIVSQVSDSKQNERLSQPEVPITVATSTSQHFQQAVGESGTKTIFTTPVEQAQHNYDAVQPANPDHQNQNDLNNNFTVQSPTMFRDTVDGIVSTLSNTEREVYDTARDRAGWEGLTEPQERLGLPSSHVISSEAFVTSCRNNAEAIGCLVVGTSLLLCRTSRTLCVLVSDGVSTAFRGALSAVFHVVQNVRSLDSLGTTKLALLEQPELGITFDKLNIWRLVQFNKCIYLNPDTLVIQNCDELFNYEELSAVPDIGWPDCFNSGVFVFSPSIHTFWQLLEFTDRQGSFDGGDQGLLNSYFGSWSSDISKKLSFIYNLMANVSYTYTPAFRQFGRNVKIVQFHGSFKPWHVKFFTNSGQISPSSPVHPTYVQFVHIWLNIFRISVLRLMSQEIQSYSASQEAICAVEILRFFPLPSESEAEFFLTPPSVRLRLAEKKLSRSISLPISEARRRKSAEFFRYTDPEEESIPETSTAAEKVEAEDSEVDLKKNIEIEDFSKSEVSAPDEQAKDKLEESDEVFKEKDVTVEKKGRDKNSLPGAEVGNYQGMKAWEQGRMDYEGSDSSDNVIKRLQFLMSRPK